jgi:hypothetical protein
MWIDGYVGGGGAGGDGHGARQAGIEGKKGIEEGPEEKARFIRSCMISLAFMLYTDGRI